MQARLSDFKSTDLLTFLVALIELQIFAVQAKRTSVRAAAEAYLQGMYSYTMGYARLFTVHRLSAQTT